jgi:hypothetical protein
MIDPVLVSIVGAAVAIVREDFEFPGWDGTVLPPTPSFDNPTDASVESFDAGWDGI